VQIKIQYASNVLSAVLPLNLTSWW